MKSNVSLLLDLGLRILMDAAAKCYTDTVADWPRDFKRLKSRVDHEGLSFLTITLPVFGSCFEEALAKEKVDSTDFPGWRKKGCLPVFLWGFTSLVFDQSGRMKENPDVAAIEGIRQIAYTFKKLHLPCTPERDNRAIQEYLRIEEQLEEFSMDDGTNSDLSAIADLLWGDVFGGNVDYQQILPKHGPGATCEHIRNNSKYVHESWHVRLQPYFPFDEFAYPNTIIGSHHVEHVNWLEEDEELPVRVCLVPKTLKTPRIIAIEPVCMQYAQQGLSRWIIKHLDANGITGGHIIFDDQSVNQKLAMKASRDGDLATIDLSSASDRVPLSGVERMLRVNPDLLDGLLACRSTHADIPGVGILKLRKFASMGSATCFPVEAMYFFTVVLIALWRRTRRPLTLRLLKELARNVYIYGDDIIVPVDAVEAVIATLAEFNCRVGVHKSFWTGKFRESCGTEAFDGEIVTPTYLRELPPNNRRDGSAICSWVATSNLFYKRGYWKTAHFMRNIVHSAVGFKLPYVLENSAGLGWWSFCQGYTVERWNKKLHRFEVRTVLASPSYQQDRLDGDHALMKCLLSLEQRGDDLPIDNGVTIATGELVDGQCNWRSRADVLLAQKRSHLHRSARYGAVSIKRRWTTPI